jgi:hypothetical protein
LDLCIRDRSSWPSCAAFASNTAAVSRHDRGAPGGDQPRATSSAWARSSSGPGTPAPARTASHARPPTTRSVPLSPHPHHLVTLSRPRTLIQAPGPTASPPTPAPHRGRDSKARQNESSERAGAAAANPVNQKYSAGNSEVRHFRSRSATAAGPRPMLEYPDLRGHGILGRRWLGSTNEQIWRVTSSRGRGEMIATA